MSRFRVRRARSRAAVSLGGVLLALCVANCSEKDDAGPTLVGVVLDSSDQPVSDANIRWREVAVGVASREDGTFSLPVHPLGSPGDRQVVLIDAPGFSPTSIAFSLLDGVQRYELPVHL